MTVSAIDILLTQKDSIWDQCSWIVPVAKALEGLTAEQAAWVPSSGGLSIWQLVNHMHYYNLRISQRIQGITSVPAAASNVATFGDSGDASDEQGWNDLVKSVTALAEQLRTQLAALQQSHLDAQYMDTEDTWGLALSRWIIHDAYHSGQIVLLRRQQGSWNIIF
ncbi:MULTISPECIES: DinB family protein [unclassified Paenibacillus]|uniref:DinB family protein n=1 Tax=unclassified Paenibacillus TaxID=185978 RepID=UPI000FE18B87|nr:MULTISPECIES: DinB family protein [unclassified Paenibacillus]MCM3172125.1 DUF1572 domain-containing protein [Paenibacillus sp. MER 99-2]